MPSKSVPIPLPLTTAPGRDGYIGGQRLINCYSAKRIVRGQGATQVWAVAGLAPFVAFPISHPVRGLIEVDGTGYAVVGPLLYTFTETGVTAQIGAIPGTGPVFMARNRRQPQPDIVIVSDGLVYICRGTTLTQSSDTDLPPPNGVIVIDGYAVYSIPDGRILASQIDDAGNIDPLSVAREDTTPDANVGIAKRGTDVVVFGTQSIGFWHDVGGDPFPLAPITSIDGTGCLSGASIVTANQTLLWVANDFTVRMLDGYGARIVSSPDIAEAIALAADRNNIAALSWVDRGNVLVEFSCDQFTYVYNLSTKAWHEQKSYGANRWRAHAYVKLGAKHVVGDYAQAKLYTIDAETCTDAGAELVSELQLTLNGFPRGLTIDRVDIDTVAGVGLNSTADQDADPKILVSASRDDGRTWGVEREASLGRLGEYQKLAYAHQFGSFFGAARLRLQCSAAVRRGIVGLTADIEALET